MASSREYLEYVLDQLSELDEVTYRMMMGEYIIYYRGKIIGGVYDDRFLIKPTRAAEELLPEAERQLPYEGGREMLAVEDLNDRAFLADLIRAVYEQLPAGRKKR
ncbi:MAG: TfoX/Sxy family protein [Erysipelotrichaceae bacterium]|nr:TfoX/Sxy family protein [Erysipelotrichaceae bacterium]MBR5048097.1 TfoX/Sxy family protein [Erysipelotrichaceae bacterium]